MNTLGIARNFFADDTGGIGIILGATHPANGSGVQYFHVEGASGGAIVRADGAGDGGGVHGGSLGWRNWKDSLGVRGNDVSPKNNYYVMRPIREYLRFASTPTQQSQLD